MDEKNHHLFKVCVLIFEVAAGESNDNSIILMNKNDLELLQIYKGDTANAINPKRNIKTLVVCMID